MAKNKSKKLAEAPTQEQVNKSLDNGLTATKGDVVWVDADKKDAAEFVANEGGVFTMSQSPAEDTTIYSAGVDPYSTDGRSKGASLDDVLGAQEVTTAPAEDDATAEAPTTEEIQSVEIDEASRRLEAKKASIAFKQARLDKQLQLSLKAVIAATVANFKKFGFEVEVESDCVEGVRYTIIVKE